MASGKNLGTVQKRALQFTTLGSASPPPPWSPGDLPGLTLWLRADLGVTKDGSNKVSLWADQSGNGNDYAQATGGLQPTLVASALNGQSVISGASSNLEGPASNIVTPGAKCDIVVVLENDSVTAFPAAITFHATSANDAPSLSFSTNAAYRDIFWGSGTGGFRTGRARATLSVPIGSYQYYRNTYDGAGGEMAFTEGATPLVNDVQPDTGSNANANCLFSGQGGASQWTGKIAEIFVAGARNFSAAEWTLIQAYMTSRYAL